MPLFISCVSKNFQFCLLFKFVAETETPSQCTIESNSLWSFLYCLFQFKPCNFVSRSIDLWKCKCDFIIFSAHFTSRLDSMKCCCVENKVKQACNNKSKSESHIWLNKNSQLGQRLVKTATDLLFDFGFHKKYPYLVKWSGQNRLNLASKIL